MTTAKQRDADEALGIASRALAEHAKRLDLFVRKTFHHGTWEIHVFSTASSHTADARGVTELEALDQVLDQISRFANRFANVHVVVGK